MPLYLFYTMVQKSQKWPKTQIKGGGGGSCLKQSMWLLHNRQQILYFTWQRFLWQTFLHYIPA